MKSRAQAQTRPHSANLNLHPLVEVIVRSGHGSLAAKSSNGSIERYHSVY